MKNVFRWFDADRRTVYYGLAKIIGNTYYEKLIAEMISTENKRKPYTDFEIAEQLKLKGYLLARRTVAKYREKLNIPIARLRTEMA